MPDPIRDPAAANPVYAPYQRIDAYGTMGLRPQPLLERARLALAAVTLVPMRFFSAFACIVIYYCICRAATHTLGELAARRVITFWGKIWCRLCLLVIGFVSIRWIRVDAAGKPRSSGPGKERVRRRQPPRRLMHMDAHAADARRLCPSLRAASWLCCPTHPSPVGLRLGTPPQAAGIVSNHLAWIDILVHMAHSFPSFAARDSTQHLAMIGLVSRKMQCIYVTRDGEGGGGASDKAGGSGSESDASQALKQQQVCAGCCAPQRHAPLPGWSTPMPPPLLAAGRVGPHSGPHALCSRPPGSGDAALPALPRGEMLARAGGGGGRRRSALPAAGRTAPPPGSQCVPAAACSRLEHALAVAPAQPCAYAHLPRVCARRRARPPTARGCCPSRRAPSWRAYRCSRWSCGTAR